MATDDALPRAARSRSSLSPSKILIGLILLVAVATFLLLARAATTPTAAAASEALPKSRVVSAGGAHGHQLAKTAGTTTISVEAGVPTALHITDIAAALKRLGGGGELISLGERDPEEHTASVVLSAGEYEVLNVAGQRTGQLVIAADPFPPRPLALEEGAHITLWSHNFPERLLRARPEGVTIEDTSRLGSGDHGTCLLVRDASVRCAAHELPPRVGAEGGRYYVLESCAYPGLALAHGGRDDTPVRLTISALISALVSS